MLQHAGIQSKRSTSTLIVCGSKRVNSENTNSRFSCNHCGVVSKDQLTRAGDLAVADDVDGLPSTLCPFALSRIHWTLSQSCCHACNHFLLDFDVNPFGGWLPVSTPAVAHAPSLDALMCKRLSGENYPIGTHVRSVHLSHMLLVFAALIIGVKTTPLR